MSLKYSNPEMTVDDRSSYNGNRERLGLSFTIDYLLFNKGVKGSKEEPSRSRTAETTADSVLDHQNPKRKEVGIRPEIQEKPIHGSEADRGERKVKEEEGDVELPEEGEEEVTTTTTTTTTTTATVNAAITLSSSSDKLADKPNQSYIALISKAILASEQKKLLLCDIYQWIMDHFPYFKSKDKNWRNSVRHNLSLNDCFIKAGRSENGKGHFWAIHPSNYQDFSKGDYHCRRARRRVRRAAGQIPLSPLSLPYHQAIVRHHRPSCWCCTPPQTPPLSCLTPRLYWPWSVQGQVGLHPGLHSSLP